MCIMVILYKDDNSYYVWDIYIDVISGIVMTDSENMTVQREYIMM